jgi:competence protein ComGC
MKTRFMKRFIKNEDGFTLIEMLLVLLVISVLIILIIPNIAAQSSNVQDTGCDAQVKMVQSQVEAYTLNEGSDPANIGALVSGGYITSEQTACANDVQIVVTNGQAQRASSGN